MLVWIQAREVTTQALPSGRNELLVHAHAGLREHQRLPVNSESETTRLQVGKQWGDLVQGHAQFRDQTFRRDRHTLPQSGEEPELRRRKVDADSSRKVLVALPAVLSGGESAQRGCHPPERVVVCRGLEHAARFRRTRRRAQRDFAQHPGEGERDNADRRRGQEQRMQGERHRLDVSVPDRGWEVLDELWIRRLRRSHARRELACEVLRKLVGEDRAEDRDADRAADLPEHRRRRRCDPEVLVRDRVLRGENEYLHHQAES